MVLQLHTCGIDVASSSETKLSSIAPEGLKTKASCEIANGLQVPPLLLEEVENGL